MYLVVVVVVVVVVCNCCLQYLLIFCMFKIHGIYNV